MDNTIILKSKAFREGEMIPRKYTCQGDDISPQLSWENLPANTKSLAVLCDDPDAPSGNFVHWVIFNIPPNITELPEAVSKQKILYNEARQGKNDFGDFGYGGPCPPALHRYFFKIFALDIILQHNAGIEEKELLNAIKGHIIAKGELMGKYKKS
jgi:Raf kinase inhibitor-like YbhB/YbcL family protein